MPKQPEPEADDPLRLDVDGLVYALDRMPPRGAGRKVVLTVRLVDGDGRPFTDRADLYSHRGRLRLAALVADDFGRKPGDVMGHLAVLLDQVERAAHASGATEPAPLVMSAAQRRAAEKLLDAPNLLDRVARAMEGLGHVGEEKNKRLVYLAATSRLMTSPLNVLLLAPPGAGKSSVLDAVTATMPPEAVLSLARLSPMALFYMGQDALRNKLIVVDEYDGQADADHAVRVLQSKGELRVSVPIKGKTENLVVRGPVAVMSGTVSTNIDAQNASRCLELALDDSAEQTRRIQAAQARRAAGLDEARVDVQPFMDAQRLLEPLDVLVPYATRLEFPARTTADRRSSVKLLGLIQAHALLHQRQRQRDAKGRLLATPADYAAVHALVAPTFGHEVDGLSDRAARVRSLLVERGAPLDKRAIAGALGWSYPTADRAIGELLAQELVTFERRRPPCTFRLVGESVLGGPAPLTPPEALR